MISRLARTLEVEVDQQGNLKPKEIANKKDDDLMSTVTSPPQNPRRQKNPSKGKYSGIIDPQSREGVLFRDVLLEQQTPVSQVSSITHHTGSTRSNSQTVSRNQPTQQSHMISLQDYTKSKIGAKKRDIATELN